MKKIIYPFLLFCSFNSFAQTEHIVDLTENVLAESQNINSGAHVFLIKYLTKSDKYYYKIESETEISIVKPLSLDEPSRLKEIDTLRDDTTKSKACIEKIKNAIKIANSFDNEEDLKDFLISKSLKDEIDDCNEVISLEEFKSRFYKRTEVSQLKKGDMLSLKIQKIKSEDNTLVKEWKRVYKVLRKSRWITSFGAGASIYLNRETFRTSEKTSMDADGMTTTSFIIEEGGNKKMFEYTPVVMFTHLNRLNKDWEIGPSAGINFDLSNISAFGGISSIWGQNMVLTLGLSFQQQDRLDSVYKTGDEVPSSLSFDQLHEKYFRINPFISLSIRLDRNPFRSNSNTSSNAESDAEQDQED